MLRGGKGIRAGDFDISIDKLDSTIKSAKGYFEYIGRKENDQVILRFNNSSFKNNYKVSDLSRMDLIIYAVLVGKSSIAELDIDYELHIPPSITQDNPEYTESFVQDQGRSTTLDNKMNMYDVLLAGVKSSG
jgi:hypothetical protein